MKLKEEKRYKRYNRIKKINSLFWNGKNTKEVIDFVTSWDSQLCAIYQICNDYLIIEPADIMRGNSLIIPLGAKITRIKRNKYQSIVIDECE